MACYATCRTPKFVRNLSAAFLEHFQPKDLEKYRFYCKNPLIIKTFIDEFRVKYRVGRLLFTQSHVFRHQAATAGKYNNGFQYIAQAANHMHALCQLIITVFVQFAQITTDQLYG